MEWKGRKGWRLWSINGNRTGTKVICLTRPHRILDREKLEEIDDTVSKEAPGMVASPCIGVCQLDPRSGFCLGCLRSLDEISAWSRVSADEQRRVLNAVAERREALVRR